MLEKFDYTYYIDATKLNPIDPTPAMADNAAMMAFYGAQAAYWESEVSYDKNQLELREAEVYEEIKSTGEKVTEASAAHRITLDKEVIALKDKLRLSKTQATLYSKACNAFNDRGQNARSINARDRSEREQSTIHLIQNEDVPKRVISSEERKEIAKRLAKRD